MKVYAEINCSPDFRQADTLDELTTTLRRAAQLIEDPLNGNRLAQSWRSLTQAEQSGLPYIPDWVRQAQVIARTADEAHRPRAQKSGPLPRRAVRASTEVLVRYWTDALGRRFSQDQNWPLGHGRLREPATTSERFVFDILKSFLGYRRAAELRSVAREFVRPE